VTGGGVAGDEEGRHSRESGNPEFFKLFAFKLSYKVGFRESGNPGLAMQESLGPTMPAKRGRLNPALRDKA